MRKIASIFIALLMFFQLLWAENVLSAVDERPTGSALQFGISTYGTLTTFGGAAISYQKFISKNSAIRVGSTIDIDYDFIDGTAEGSGDRPGFIEGDFAASIETDFIATHREGGVSCQHGPSDRSVRPIKNFSAPGKTKIGFTDFQIRFAFESVEIRRCNRS